MKNNQQTNCGFCCKIDWLRNQNIKQNQSLYDMGNQNKKQARSVSNPILDGSQQKAVVQNQNDVKPSSGQTPKMGQEQKDVRESQQSPVLTNLKKQENEQQKSLKEKRFSSENNRDSRNIKTRESREVRKSYDSPSDRIKTCSGLGSGGGGGKKRKSLEDIMMNEIQKLKKYQPPKNLQTNQIQSLQNYKNRLQTYGNQNSSNQSSHIRTNQQQLLMNHLIPHSRSISPSQNQNRSQSPETTMLNKSGLFIPYNTQNVNLDYKFDGLEEFSSLKKKQFRRRDNNQFTNSPLQRSQTNPKKRQNWELTAKQTSTYQRSNNFSTTAASNFNKTNYTSISKQNQNNALTKHISPEFNPQNQESNTQSSFQQQGQGLPQLSQKQSGNKSPPTFETLKKYSPRRIEELFSIYEGSNRKSSHERSKEKNSYLKQISEILEKKYQNNSKKKLELERVEPYLRAKSINNNNNNSNQTPRLPVSQNKKKQELAIPMYIVNSPNQIEEDDFEKYCKPDTQRNVRQSYNSTSSSNNPLKIQNRQLRSQINPISYSNHRSSSNGHKEPLKNLSKLRYYKPYQIEFDQQQYDILNKSNINNSNNHVKFHEYLKEQQQQEQFDNTFYSKNNQSFYDDPLNQSKTFKETNQSLGQQASTTNNEFRTTNPQEYSELKQSDIKLQEIKQLDQSNQNSKIQENQPPLERTFSPEERGQEKDPLSASFMFSTKNNFGNQSYFAQDSQYGFSEANSNHLTMGFDRMKIRKYQNNSQVGILSNQDIYKIYMKNPLLDVYTSTLKQTQRPQQNSQKANINILNQSMNATQGQFSNNNSATHNQNLNNSSIIYESKELQKQQLIKTYQPRKLKYTKSQI